MKVLDVFGPSKFIPADIIFVHVDLSVVSSEYRQFAQKYPASINLNALDIRKSTYCPDLVNKDDVWDGPVIVKSNLNHAGLPEQIFEQYQVGFIRRKTYNICRKLGLCRGHHLNSKADYKIFDSISETPATYFTDDYVVQKFQPEVLEDKYVLREYYFLGDLEYVSVEVGSDPIMTTGQQIEASRCPAPQALRNMRDRLHLDYGKIDYVLIDGEPVVFDANKTVGTRSNPTKATWEIARCLADGVPC